MKNDSSQKRNSTNRHLFETDAKLVGTAASLIVAGLYLLGFSNIKTYLDSFSLTMLEINIPYYAAAAFGVEVIVSSKLKIVALFLLFIVILLVISLARNLYGPKGLLSSSVVMLVLTCWLAVETGANYGIQQAQAIQHEQAGKIAYCKLVSNGRISKQIKDQFEQKSRMNQLRKIIETRDMMYFTYNIEDKIFKEQYYGVSLAFKKSDIEYCRFLTSK